MYALIIIIQVYDVKLYIIKNMYIINNMYILYTFYIYIYIYIRYICTYIYMSHHIIHVHEKYLHLVNTIFYLHKLVASRYVLLCIY